MSDRDEQLGLEKMLEAATASELPEDVPLDGEAARLREAWLAMGEALEAIDVDANDEALVEALRRRAGRRRTMQRAAAALAASLLVAVTAVLYFARTELPDSVAVRQDIDAPNDVDQSPIAQDDELAWDDHLDLEIALVAQAMYEMDNPLGRTERAVLNLWLQIDQLKREMASGTL